MNELKRPAGRNAHYDAHIADVGRLLGSGGNGTISVPEDGARAFARALGLALQPAALQWFAPTPLFEAFCAQRLDPAGRGLLYGDSTRAVDPSWLIERAYPRPGVHNRSREGD